MDIFEFRTVPHIVNGVGTSARLGQIIGDNFNVKSAFIVTDKGLSKLGMAGKIAGTLKKSGLEVTLYDKVIADPPESLVLDAANAAKAAQAELIVGFGGGSSMDVAKVVAVLNASDQPLEEMYGVEQYAGPRLPLVLMPTTAGTGSEVTNISVITTGKTTKMAIVSAPLYADIALLDPELTLGLPRHITAATGIDAMVHAIEAYTNVNRKNPVSDALAREALRLLTQNLVPACLHPANIKARSNMLLGAMLAGQSFSNSPVGAIHGLAYPLGGFFHIPHGHSNALVMPHVMRHNAPEAAPLYAELAVVIMPSVSGSDEAKAAWLIDFLEKIIDATGIERQLRQLGIEQKNLATLAENAMIHERVLVNNPRHVSYDDALRIYREAY
jgi:alcohol dehydrogenase class IV